MLATLEPSNPSFKDEESTAPYNEEKARAEFGNEFVDRLKQHQEEFRGDWWQLAKLVKNLEDDAKPRPDGLEIKEERLRDWNSWRKLCRKSRPKERVHLEHADLRHAHLEHANLSEAHLEHADLWRVHLEHADLVVVHLEHADLAGAQLEHADLTGAQLEHADLLFASFEHARLYRADLNEAYVRGAKGLLLDDNRVRDIDIEGDAPDPWSVLRRKYTGPWFFVHLLLLLVFFAPYLGRAVYLSATGKMEQWTIEKYAALGGRLEEAPEPVRELSRAHAELQRRFDETHEERRAMWVLLGDKAGWRWLLPMVVIVYNVLRGYLTLRVSMLRDAEERSQHSPTLEEYYGMSHPLRDLGDPESGWKRWRNRLVGWLLAIVACLMPGLAWEHRKGPFPEGPAPKFWWVVGAVWRWVSETPLRFGLYRLHVIARVMFIAVVLVVAWHTWDWMRNTWIVVPKG